jgi:uncharacterized protein (TIGR03437 family)
MRHILAVLLSAAALYATPQLRLSTSTVGPLNIAVGQNGPNQTITTTNIGTGTLTLSASANVPWIAANIVGTNVQIALNTSTLTQGIVTGLVTVSAAGAIDSPQTVAVTVMMGGGVPNAINLYMPPGGAASTTFTASNTLNATAFPPAGATLAILAEGGGSFQTTAAYQVSATAPASTTPETSFNGRITVTSSGFTPDVKTVPVTINVTNMAIATLVQSSIQFNVGQGAAPVAKWIQLGNAGAAAVSVTGATVSAGSNNSATGWLTTSLNGPCLIAGVGACVVATGDPTGLTPGKYTATVTIASNAKNGPVAVPVEMDVLATGPPVSYYTGVVDNAVYQIGATISPGELVAVRGEQFTTGAPVAATTLPLGTTLGGATVYVNGAAVPTYYVAASHVENQGGQITFQVPYGTPAGPATVRVDRSDNGTVQTGNTISVNVAPIAPTLLEFPLNVTGNALTTVNNMTTEAPVGTNYAIATFPDFSTFPIPTTTGIPSRPAKVGDTLVFYGLGFGQTTPGVTEGIAVSGAATVANCLMVFGQSVLPGANIYSIPSYCGLTPGLVGLYQVNAVVPVGTPTGSAVPVFLQVGSATTNSVAIAVQ